ncbi:MAG: bifunctional oligoribonuclease/PAP phosphatase NrnA [Synergistaceae bacterium]|nr:bifunctional oligoribonuclease/PAP phosphatase NrnA [Synergistaceae bacterium]
MRKTVDEITRTLSSGGRWLVLMHEKADGDTSGCGVAIASLGLRLKRDVMLGGPDPFPEKYMFMIDEIQYCQLNAIPESFMNEESVVICVDTSNADRSVKGLLDAKGRATILNIDHHGDNTKYGDVNWVDQSASATGEMVTELLLTAGWGITPYEADVLYAAIVTDNGNFSYPSSSERSHECAVELLRAGASPGMIAEELETNLSPNALRLWARAFARVTLFSDGFCAYYWLTESDFEETGSARHDIENLTNFLLRIRGVRLAALCTETADSVRVSLRARSPMSARDIAARFDGGGHILASGCTILEPLDEALNHLRTEMERHAKTRVSGAG